MKEILVFLFICFAIMHGMEQPERTDVNSDLGCFGNWPDELRVYLFSFIGNGSSMKEVFQRLAQLSLINSTFKQLADDQLLLLELVQRYSQFHKVEAEKEFLHGIEQIIKGNRKYTKIVIALACNVAITDQELIKAASEGNKDLVELLIDTGMDIDKQDCDGNTALMYASIHNQCDVIKILVDGGADVNATNHDQATALMIACYSGCQVIVKLLLEKSAHVNAVDAFCSTALMFASINGYYTIAKLLLEAGADVNASDDLDNTALMDASQQDHQELVKLLLDLGADVTAVDRDGNTALMIALASGHKEIIDLLTGHY